VSQTPFEKWTRTDGKTVYRRSRARRRVNRATLALFGATLILFSVGLVFTDVQSVGDPSAVPNSETLRLTIPKMKRVRNIPVYNAEAGDKAKLAAGTIHLKDTGFPWQREANVYIAGHRLGYPRTKSFLVFWDLNRLRRGDRVVLRDSEGRAYVYRVFDKLIVGPGQSSVKDPIPGKNIVTLQTCTLPNYSKRLLVRAELIPG
jgi:sortase A